EANHQCVQESSRDARGLLGKHLRERGVLGSLRRENRVLSRGERVCGHAAPWGVTSEAAQPLPMVVSYYLPVAGERKLGLLSARLPGARRGSRNLRPVSGSWPRSAERGSRLLVAAFARTRVATSCSCVLATRLQEAVPREKSFNVVRP